MKTSDKIIVALDLDTLEETKTIVEELGELISIYKVGHQLFTSEGPKVVSFLKELGKEVFLDLKLHEIPNSVAKAVSSAGRLGVSMVTVHASGGKKMLEAAVQSASGFSNLKILALTVVTGLSNEDLKEIGFVANCEKQVLNLAKLAEKSGCNGVVASPLEVKVLREKLKKEMLIVTPGVRLLGSDNFDQNRVGTPKEAIKNGASQIIVGRQIVQAQKPLEIVNKILNTI